MNNECNCEVVYKASDGKEFKTLEECRAYENRPKVFLITYEKTEFDSHRRYEKSSYKPLVYINRETAEKEIKRLNIIESSLRQDIRGYRVTDYKVITLEISGEDVLPSLQERITNQSEESNKLITWWNNLIRYRGED